MNLQSDLEQIFDTVEQKNFGSFLCRYNNGDEFWVTVKQKAKAGYREWDEIEIEILRKHFPDVAMIQSELRKRFGMARSISSIRSKAWQLDLKVR